MKKLLTLVFTLACLSGFGQSLQWRNFNSNQFGSNLFSLSLKDGVLLTNPVVRSGTITGNGSGLTNLNGANLQNASVTYDKIVSVNATNVTGGPLSLATILVSNSLTNTGVYTVTKDLAPYEDAQYSLGALTDRWKTLWVSDSINGGTFTGNGSGLTNLAPAATYVENVLYYGADKTGVASSYNALTNAIGHAVVSGFPVYFPSGIYLITNSVTLPTNSNLKIFGDGIGKSILTYPVSSNAIAAFQWLESVSKTNIAFQGLTISGDVNLSTNTCYAILLATNITDLLVDSCEIKNFSVGIAKQTIGNHRVKVINSRFINMGMANGGAILLDGADNVTIQNNLFDDSGNGGTNYNLMNGLYILSGNNLSVVGNTFNGTNSNITIGNSANTLYLTNAVIQNNRFHGVTPSSLSFMVDSTIAGNEWESCRTISMGSGFGVRFVNNIVRGVELANDVDSGGNQVAVVKCTNCVVSQNTIVSMATNVNGTALQIVSNSPNCLIENNYIRGAMLQIRLTGGNFSTVQGNLLDTAIGSAPKCLYIESATNIYAAFNRMIGASGYGLYDQVGTSNRYVGNRIEGGCLTLLSGAVLLPIPGLLVSSATSRAQTGTNEIGLTTNTIPIMALENDGDVLEGVMAGNFGTNSNLKRIRLKMDAAVLFDSGSLAFNGSAWALRFTFIRSSATVVRSVVTFHGDTSLLTTNAYYTFDFPSNLSTTANVLKVLATGVSDNDVTQTMAVVKVFPK